MTARVKRWESGGQAGYNFYCPGCREFHTVRTEGGPSRWSFNGDVDLPVFGPSVLVSGKQTVRDADGKWTGDFVLDAAGNPLPMRCHSFVGSSGAKPGEIIFLADSTHALAGKTVELPPWPRDA